MFCPCQNVSLIFCKTHRPVKNSVTILLLFFLYMLLDPEIMENIRKIAAKHIEIMYRNKIRQGFG